MQRDSETAEPCYAEARLGFYQPDNPEFISNTWIRKPENIKVAHETLKDFGYENLYTKFELYDSPCLSCTIRHVRFLVWVNMY